MKFLLENEAIRQALAALAVVILAALADWIKSKCSHSRLVDEYWCYIQPAVDWAVNNIGPHANIKVLAAMAAARFANSYRAYERAEPSARLCAAAEQEITEALIAAADADVAAADETA